MKMRTLFSAVGPVGHTVVVRKSMDENCDLSNSAIDRLNNTLPPAAPLTSSLAAIFHSLNLLLLLLLLLHDLVAACLNAVAVAARATQQTRSKRDRFIIVDFSGALRRLAA